MKARVYKMHSAIWLLALSLLAGPDRLLASPEEADQAEEKARAAFVEHFNKFVQDKNVMGKAAGLDGKPVAGGPNKTQFNKDDAASYKSDLTYHDDSFLTPDSAFNKKSAAGPGPSPSSKPRELAPFISPHGGLSEAGGSSALERKAYELHDRFSKQNQANAATAQPQKGVEYESAFKKEIREVMPQSSPGASPAPGTSPQPIAVFRTTLRDEAKNELDKVGEDSAQTIERSARDKGYENDSSTLDNSLLLREAAGRATKSWWNATLANLGQRNANRAFRDTIGSDERPKLNEDTPSCDAWAQKELQEGMKRLQKRAAGKPVDPKDIAALQKDIQETKQKCDQVTKFKYDTVTIEDKYKQNGKGSEIKTGDIDREDGYARDMRNQLEVLKSAGKDIKSLKGNWKYDAAEETQKITTEYDEQGNPAKQEDWTVRDQLESYNQQLKDAAKGFKDIKERWPDLQMNENDIRKFQIDPESQSAMEINSLTPGMKEDFGVKTDPKQPTDTSAENYEDLLKQAKGPASR